MAQEVLAMRHALVLQERSDADALLLKLDRLICDQVAEEAPAQCHYITQMPEQLLARQANEEPTLYQVRLYNPEFSDLQDIITTASFVAAVQLVVDRLDSRGNHVVDATWQAGRGQLKVTTLADQVIATVHYMPVQDTIVVRPAVLNACQALQSGDMSHVEQLFGLALMAA